MRPSVFCKTYRNLSLVLLITAGLLLGPVSTAWARPLDLAGSPGWSTSLFELVQGAWGWVEGLLGDRGPAAKSSRAEAAPPKGPGNTTDGGDCGPAPGPDGCPK